jgi:hypothetical protein
VVVWRDVDAGTEVAVAVGVGAVVAVAVGAAVVAVAVAAVVLVAVGAVVAVAVGVAAVTVTPLLWFARGDWPDDCVVDAVCWLVVVAAAVDAVAVW